MRKTLLPLAVLAGLAGAIAVCYDAAMKFVDVIFMRVHKIVEDFAPILQKLYAQVESVKQSPAPFRVESARSAVGTAQAREHKSMLFGIGSGSAETAV